MSRPPAPRLLAGALAALSLHAAPAAIVNKQLANSGQGTFATPVDLANEIFNGSSKVQAALGVLIALVLLGALAATVAGIWQVFRGQRGGLEVTASGVFGVIVLTVGLGVVM